MNCFFLRTPDGCSGRVVRGKAACAFPWLDYLNSLNISVFLFEVCLEKLANAPFRELFSKGVDEASLGLFCHYAGNLDWFYLNQGRLGLFDLQKVQIWEILPLKRAKIQKITRYSNLEIEGSLISILDELLSTRGEESLWVQTRSMTDWKREYRIEVSQDQDLLYHDLELQLRNQ